MNPEYGRNEPRYQQVHAPASLHGSFKPVRKPTVNHKVQEEHRLTTEQMDEVQNRNPIMPYERGSPPPRPTRVDRLSTPAPSAFAEPEPEQAKQRRAGRAAQRGAQPEASKDTAAAEDSVAVAPEQNQQMQTVESVVTPTRETFKQQQQ